MERKEYQCKKCRVHRVDAPLKGHKGICPWQHCACNDCEQLPETARNGRKRRTAPKEMTACDVIAIANMKRKDSGTTSSAAKSAQKQQARGALNRSMQELASKTPTVHPALHMRRAIRDFSSAQAAFVVEELSAKGLTHDIVSWLMEPYIQAGRTLYCDNYYTLSQLFLDLADNATNACGTTRNRKGLPTAFKDANLIAPRQKFCMANGSLLAVKYKKRRDVKMLSTVHSAKMIDTRKSNHQRERIMQPGCTYYYNKFMGPVDRSDQMVWREKDGPPGVEYSPILMSAHIRMNQRDIYKQYHYSPKAWRELKEAVSRLEDKVLKPTNLGGTHWVSQLETVLTTLLHNFNAVHVHFENTVLPWTLYPRGFSSSSCTIRQLRHAHAGASPHALTITPRAALASRPKQRTVNKDSRPNVKKAVSRRRHQIGPWMRSQCLQMKTYRLMEEDQDHSEQEPCNTPPKHGSALGERTFGTPCLCLTAWLTTSLRMGAKKQWKPKTAGTCGRDVQRCTPFTKQMASADSPGHYAKYGSYTLMELNQRVQRFCKMKKTRADRKNCPGLDIDPSSDSEAGSETTPGSPPPALPATLQATMDSLKKKKEELQKLLDLKRLQRSGSAAILAGATAALCAQGVSVNPAGATAVLGAQGIPVNPAGVTAALGAQGVPVNSAGATAALTFFFRQHGKGNMAPPKKSTLASAIICRRFDVFQQRGGWLLPYGVKRIGEVVGVDGECGCGGGDSRHRPTHRHQQDDQRGSPYIKHLFDIWHVAKSVKKKLQHLSQRKGCQVLKPWVGSIINHLYWAVVSSPDDNRQLAVDKWKSEASALRKAKNASESM
ncbi:hypothetical protein Bbelb_425340 [Branchiostoma belcheri]|nr:hypothetical protein Bbelb_425340 [Branchiostoma belcheri]